MLGNTVQQKRPFTVPELVEMYHKLDFSSDQELLIWTIIILSFRTLLRKSNLIPTTADDYEHVLRRRDIIIHDWGILVKVGSTKTLRCAEYVLDIPVRFVSNPALCAASAVIHHLDSVSAPEDGPLFVWKDKSGKRTPVLYASVLAHIKLCASGIGLDPEQVGCHSLRRSGAAHLHSIGIPLIDIMSLGDWRSMCVLEYLVTPRNRKDQIQEVVAASLSL